MNPYDSCYHALRIYGPATVPDLARCLDQIRTNAPPEHRPVSFSVSTIRRMLRVLEEVGHVKRQGNLWFFNQDSDRPEWKRGLVAL